MRKNTSFLVNKMYNCWKFILFIVLWIDSNRLVSCEKIEVDLSGYEPNIRTRNVLQKYINLSEDVTTLKITNIDNSVGFFVIQLHSYIEKLTLSYNSTLQLHSHVTGTNIGLVYGYADSTAKFYVFRDIKYFSRVTVLLVISLYDAYDPVPGGCNLSFSNMVAPYQLVSYNDEYITVESQPPQAYGVSCNDNYIRVDVYHMFLREYDKSIETYFDGINKMLTVDSIRSNGRKVPSETGYLLYHRLFSSYRGTGEVFAIISTYRNRSSAYVPAVSYGCNIGNWDESCIGPVTRYWKFICALLLILGLLTCFYGHKFFKLTLFMTGFAFGIFLTYFIITLDGHFAIDEKMITSIIIGFFYGIIWLFIWWKFGIPLLSVHLNFILGGFLVASIIFYAGLADISIFHSDINFWITFVCIILACIIVWAPASMYGHIFGCSFLGSYAFLITLNYYLGGNLQYIIINTYRRATVDNFNNAVISPPFQLIDIVHSVAWVILIILGCYVQLRDQRGKPPFPPHRNGAISGTRVTERTPLIPSENVAVSQYV